MKFRKMALSLVLIILLGCLLTGCSGNPEDLMREQLEALDSTSYREIRDWLDEEAIAEEFDSINISFEIVDEVGERLIRRARGPMDNEARFVEWSFTLEDNHLTLEFVYLTMENYVRSELRGVDYTSFAEIKDWLENFEADDDFTIYVWSVDEAGDIIEDGIIDDAERFVEWRVSFGHGVVDFDFVYLDPSSDLIARLETLDRTSYSDIKQWLEEAEEYDELFVFVSALDDSGDWIGSSFLDNESLFIEWDVEIEDGLWVEVYLFYYTVNSFGLGETFLLDGLEITFGTELFWGEITNSWSRDYQSIYFMIEVTLENVSDSTGRFSWARKFGPAGTELDSIWGEEDSIEGAQLRAGATQSGYITFRYEGSGYYAAEFSDWPFTVEVVFYVDGGLRPVPEPTTVQDVINLILEEYYDGVLDDLMEVSMEARGDHEVALIYTLLIEVPDDGREALIEGISEELTTVEDGVELIALVFMIELNVNEFTIVVIYRDMDGAELYSRTLDFAR